jgi:hypothetical protein
VDWENRHLSDPSATDVLNWATTGKIGIGSSTPKSVLSISTNAQSASTNNLLTVASTTNKIIFQVTAGGILRMGDGKSVTSTNVLQYNAPSSTVDVLTGLNTGQLTSPTNPGIFTFYNMPVNSSSADNTVHSATFSSDSNPIMTWYSQSDGAGSVDNLRVGVGTTTPTVLFHVENPTASASTTIRFGRSNNTKGSCLQLYSPNGTAYKVFVTNAGAITAVAGTCE